MHTHTLNIAEPLLPQLTEQLGGMIEADRLTLPSQLGNGYVWQPVLPKGIEMTVLDFALNAPLNFAVTNPTDSDWHVLNINLSAAAVSKTVNGQVLELHRLSQTAVLLYGPATQLSNLVPAQSHQRLLMLRIHRSLFDAYGEGLRHVRVAPGQICCEELPQELESTLKEAIKSATSAILRHSLVLNFLNQLSLKLAKRESGDQDVLMHEEDLKALFKTAAFLRTHVQLPIANNAELARQAGMGTSKFKLGFKQVFGLAPKQYHRAQSMHFARQSLRQHTCTISELADQLGYADVSKFSRAYKGAHGTSPSQDRGK